MNKKNWKMIYGTLWSERIAGKGEDAEPLAICLEGDYPSGVMAVLDGMGGSGSTVRTLSDGTTHTDAWLASRFVRDKVKDYYLAQSAEREEDEGLAMGLQEYLYAELERYKDELGIQPSGIQGKMIRVLPTTLAMIRWSVEDDRLSIDSMWAGDSRNYVLDDTGLRLLSQDHVQGDVDAWGSLRDDPPMTNHISQSTVWTLDDKMDSTLVPSILISCTDGCFGYLPSPMHFEKMLIETFLEAEDMDGWMTRMKMALLPIAGDDFSMAVLMNEGDWEKLKVSLKERLAVVEKKYIEPFEGVLAVQKNIANMQKAIWNEYANDAFNRLVFKDLRRKIGHMEALQKVFEGYMNRTIEEENDVTE